MGGLYPLISVHAMVALGELSSWLHARSRFLQDTRSGTIGLCSQESHRDHADPSRAAAAHAGSWLSARPSPGRARIPSHRLFATGACAEPCLRSVRAEATCHGIKVAIVGGGVAELTAAAGAESKGCKVKLLEKKPDELTGRFEKHLGALTRGKAPTKVRSVIE